MAALETAVITSKSEVTPSWGERLCLWTRLLGGEEGCHRFAQVASCCGAASWQRHKDELPGASEQISPRRHWFRPSSYAARGLFPMTQSYRSKALLTAAFLPFSCSNVQPLTNIFNILPQKELLKTTNWWIITQNPNKNSFLLTSAVFSGLQPINDPAAEQKKEHNRDLSVCEGVKEFGHFNRVPSDPIINHPYVWIALLSNAGERMSLSSALFVMEASRNRISSNFRLKFYKEGILYEWS